MIQRHKGHWQLEASSAEAYERYLVPLLFASGAQYLVELAAPESGEGVLDVTFSWDMGDPLGKAEKEIRI